MRHQKAWRLKEAGPNIHVLEIPLVRNRDWEFWTLHLADVHWDNPHCNRNLLERHLNQAKEHNIPVFIYGDFFCAMQGRYDPRSSKDDVRPEHQKGDYLDALVNTAEQYLLPYKDQLALLGRGNHEQKIRQHLETDLLDRLAYRLRTAGGITRVGGYQGWVRYMLSTNKRAGHRNCSLRQVYHHGFGRGGPVTKGAIDFNRMAEMYSADLYISGHVHQKMAVAVRKHALTDLNAIRTRNLWYLRCGPYKDDMGCDGTGWHIERGQGPRPMGGWWLKFYWSRSKSDVLVQPVDTGE